MPIATRIGPQVEMIGRRAALRRMLNLAKKVAVAGTAVAIAGPSILACNKKAPPIPTCPDAAPCPKPQPAPSCPDAAVPKPEPAHFGITQAVKEGRRIKEQKPIQVKAGATIKLSFIVKIKPNKYTENIKIVFADSEENIVDIKQEGSLAFTKVETLPKTGELKVRIDATVQVGEIDRGKYHAIIVLKEGEVPVGAQMNVLQVTKGGKGKRQTDKQKALACCRKLASPFNGICRGKVNNEGWTFIQVKRKWGCGGKAGKTSGVKKVLKSTKDAALRFCQKLASPFNGICRGKVKNEGWTLQQVKNKWGR